MQGQHGPNLQNKPYHRLIVVIISLVVLSIFLLWIIFEPIIYKYIFPNIKIYDGLNYYISEEYKEYDDSQLFNDFVESLNLNSDLSPVYFYHIDNSRRNTVLYGKVGNMYAIDFEAEKTAYDEIKRSFLAESTYVENIYDYEIYSVNREFTDSSNGFLAFCDETSTLRCILITDRKSNGMSIRNFLVGETTLRFQGQTNY